MSKNEKSKKVLGFFLHFCKFFKFVWKYIIFKVKGVGLGLVLELEWKN